MNKISIFLAALTFSFSASAQWQQNIHGIPVVGEENDPDKVLALYACQADSQDPQLALGDRDLPLSSEGKVLSFKARVDRGPIYDIEAKIFDIGSRLMGVYIGVQGDAIKELMNGNYIRFQFKSSEGVSQVETYSLTGFTKLFTAATLECANNAEPDDAEFFEPEQKHEFF